MTRRRCVHFLIENASFFMLEISASLLLLERFFLPHSLPMVQRLGTSLTAVHRDLCLSRRWDPDASGVAMSPRFLKHSFPSVTCGIGMLPGIWHAHLRLGTKTLGKERALWNKPLFLKGHALASRLLLTFPGTTHALPRLFLRQHCLAYLLIPMPIPYPQP